MLDEEKIKEDDILKELEDIKTSTIIMGESYIELYKQGIKVPIEDIANTTLEKISSQNLSEENKKELLKVYENGRPKETYENKDHIKLLTEEFEQTLDFLDKELTTLYPEYLTIKDQIYEEKISGVRINVLNIREPNLKLIFEILILDDDFYLIDVYG